MGKRDAQIHETDVAASVVRWLEEFDWKVYQEVSLGSSARTVDIVAVRGPLVWAIECKVSLGLAVLEQAHSLLGLANYVSVAVQSRRRGETGRFATKAMKDMGIGMFFVRRKYVGGSGEGFHWVAERDLEPRLCRRVGPIVSSGARNIYRKLLPIDQRKTVPYPYLRDLLVDEQRTYAAAGNPSSKRWSPWVKTCEEVLRYVQAHPGCAPAACIRMIPHHYQTEATARGSMAAWVREGRVPGVEERRNGRLLSWWPKQKA